MEAGLVVNVDDRDDESAGSRKVDAPARESVLIDPPHYAEPMILRALEIDPGAQDRRCQLSHDEFLYVLRGRARIHLDEGASHELSEHGAAHIRAGRAYHLESEEGSTCLSFLVPAPGTPWADALVKETEPTVDVAALGAQASQEAASDRQFEVLFDASRGSRGATMFVGFIPTSGAPEHYHLYDEICVIVRGSGVLHTRGIEQPITSGSAFHVAPRLLHALENPNDDDLWVLGVFRPEGSAAAAFYPDGTPAPNNED